MSNKNRLQSRRINRNNVPQSESASQAAAKKSFFTKLSPIDARQAMKKQGKHKRVLSEECPNPSYSLLDDTNDVLGNDSRSNTNDGKKENDVKIGKQFRSYLSESVRSSLTVLGPVALLSLGKFLLSCSYTD